MLDLRQLVRDIPDFPKAGVIFKDITPLLAHRDAFTEAVSGLAAPFAKERVEVVCGIEARGFILAGAVADRLGAGFIPVRKAGKLPWEIEKTEYELEYGTDLLEIHRDAIRPGERVVVVDDVLATGGTAAATGRLVRHLGGELLGYSFLIELAFLGGRAKLEDDEAHVLICYE